jgi:hypothetical protein
MTRNLKALGLALMAAFALSAVAASAASAAEQGKLTASESVTLTGTETGAGANFLEIPILGTTTCPGSTYTGHKYNVTPHERIPSGETTATITPHYATICTTSTLLGNRPTTVTMNGCDYVFHIGNTTPAGNANGTYGVTADLKCPTAATRVEVHVYKSGSTAHLDSESVCTIKFGETGNQGLVGLHLTNTATDFDITGEITGASYTREGSLCGSGSGANAKLGVDATVKGHNAAGQNINVNITD